MRPIYVVLLLLTAVVNGVQAQKLEGEFKVDNLYSSISYLSSKELFGRAPGTKGDSLAAFYLRDELSKLNGVRLLADGGLQSFQIHNIVKMNVIGSYSGKKIKMVTFSRTSLVEGEFDGKVVFVGYGLKRDYKKVNVKNKWVAICDRTPDTSGVNEFTTINQKMDYARSKGALGIIVWGLPNLYPNSYSSDPFETIRKGSDYPIIYFSLSDIFGDSILNFDAQHKNGEPYEAIESEGTLNVSVNTERADSKTFNVAAIIEAKGKYKDEVVIIGAHYDALGAAKGGLFAAGADDNASGCATLLELARILNDNKSRLKRSVVLCFFGAEEANILGSQYFNAYLPYKNKKEICMINLDMIGRMVGQTKLYGTDKLHGIDELLDGLSLENSEIVRTNMIKGFSDHRNFALRNVPAFGLITDKHKDYHTPGDVVEKINFEGILTICNYWLNVLDRLVVQCYPLLLKEDSKSTV